MATDSHYMQLALDLAAQGAGWVNPNPQVGCVIVRDGHIIGRGWHTAFGRLHAEREALADCKTQGNDPAGATAYVTLEPCCHWGKTPPCTEGLIEAGIARVVMGAPDPNPLVAGKGVQALRKAGIEVTEGVMVDECQAINRYWLHYIQTKRPYVIAKFAMTLDGKIGLERGQSCWLTGNEARMRTHADRQRFAAICVGVGTVLADDPQLTCRLEGQVKQPLRVVVDSHLRMPLDCQLMRTLNVANLLVVTTDDAPQERVAAFRAAGATVLQLPGIDGHVDLDRMLECLGGMGIDSLIVEGGPTLHGAFFKAGLVNAVQAYVSPTVFGGTNAPSPIEGLGVASAQDAPRVHFESMTQLGEDILLEGVMR